MNNYAGLAGSYYIDHDTQEWITEEEHQKKEAEKAALLNAKNEKKPGNRATLIEE